MTTLYGWGPMFGIRGPSPFVLKAEVQLQMLGVAYGRALADLDSVSKHKAPYVRLDDGRVLEDSTFIRFHFEEALGRDLDEGLSAEQRAAAWGLERMLEDRLSFIMVHERWLEGDNFRRGPALFFGRVPEAARAAVIEGVLADTRKRLHSQGIGRHTRDERMALAARDVGAVAAQLGGKPYLFGDRPTALDAAAFGVLSACAAPVFDTPLIGIVRGHENLNGYLARMEARYFRNGDWDAAR
ncbi:MAG: glutathione S-transferase family protein [Polyangiales bacterium]